MGLPDGAQLAEAEEEGGIFGGCRIGMFFIVKINDMMYRHFLFTLSHPEKYVKMASYRVSTRSMFLGNI